MPLQVIAICRIDTDWPRLPDVPVIGWSQWYNQGRLAGRLTDEQPVGIALGWVSFQQDAVMFEYVV
jgi:hypothetical protein